MPEKVLAQATVPVGEMRATKGSWVLVAVRVNVPRVTVVSITPVTVAVPPGSTAIPEPLIDHAERLAVGAQDVAVIAGGVELEHEGVDPAVGAGGEGGEDMLAGMGRVEVERAAEVAGHEGVALRVHGHGPAAAGAGAGVPVVVGPEQRAVRVELGDEDVGGARGLAGRGLVQGRRAGERAGDVGVAGGVDSNPAGQDRGIAPDPTQRGEVDRQQEASFHPLHFESAAAISAAGALGAAGPPVQKSSTDHREFILGSAERRESPSSDSGGTLQAGVANDVPFAGVNSPHR